MCVEECPKESFLFSKADCEKNIAEYKKKMICDYNLDLKTCGDFEKAVNENKCAGYALESKPGKI